MKDTLNGIPRVDLRPRARWKRTLSWWAGGKLVSTRLGTALYRGIVVPIEAPVLKASGGRLRPSFTAPIVVLTSTGARTGRRLDTALAYFTDGGDVILIASNWGGDRHPSWYHNLSAHPDCELHIGPRGGRFVARETDGDDRDRLFGLAERSNKMFVLYERRTQGVRQIPVLRLTPVGSGEHGP